MLLVHKAKKVLWYHYYDLYLITANIQGKSKQIGYF